MHKGRSSSVWTMQLRAVSHEPNMPLRFFAQRNVRALECPRRAR